MVALIIKFWYTELCESVNNTYRNWHYSNHNQYHFQIRLSQFKIKNKQKSYNAEHQGKAMPKLHLIKIVSDAADGTVEEWSQRIERLQATLLEATLNKIEILSQAE